MPELTIWDYEHSLSRQIAKKSGLRRTCRAVFESIPAASVTELLPADYSLFPGETGKSAAVLDETLVIPNRQRPGYSDVTLTYRTLTCDEWLEANPDHGVLLGDVMTQAERVRLARSTTDSWGSLSVVEGPGTEGRSWKVISGSNVIIHFDYVAEIYAVIEDMATYYDPYTSMTEFYNSTLLNFMPTVGIKGSGESDGTTFTTTVDKFTESMEGRKIKIEGTEYRIVTYVSPMEIELDDDPEVPEGADFEILDREEISGTATSSLSNGDILLTSTEDTFYAPMVGSAIKIEGTNYVITNYVSPTVVHLNANPNVTGASFAVASSAIGKWRMIGLSSTPRVGQANLNTCRYQFGLNRRGWNQPTISEGFVVTPYRSQVVDFDTGDPLPDTYCNVSRPVRTDSYTRQFIFFEGGDFSGLADLLTDSWTS